MRRVCSRRSSAAGVMLCLVASLACSGAGDAPAAVSASDGNAEAAAAVSAPAAVEPESLRAGPNLILVTLDTLRADRIGAYGYAAAETPVLDRLAAEGVRFERVASTVPITLPAHGSIMTGQNPPRHGLRDNGFFLPDGGVRTLAEVLAADGYATGGFIASFVLDRRFGIARGFDHYTRFERGAQVDVEQLLNVQRRADQVVDDAIEWLDRQQGPFFAWVHLYDPHTPYEPPEPYASRFAGRPYDGEIAYTDEQLGRLVRHLEETGRAAETLLIITADHGEGLGDHGETWHAFFVYDSTIRVPLIVRAEGLPSGLVVRGQTSIVDVLTTSLALLGIEDPDAAERDGRDLRALIADPGAAGHAAYAESFVPLLNFGWSELRALQAEGYKYIAAPRPELYHLNDDPREQQDLAALHPERVAAMEQRLAALVGDDDPLAVAATGSAVDPETAARLRSLGYLGGSTTAASTDRGIDPKDRIAAYESFTRGFEDATEAVRAGRWAEAESRLRALDRIAPDQFIIQHYLGRTALGRGDAAAAVALLERAVQLNPSYYSQTHVELARAYRGVGQPERAIDLLQEGVAAHPSDFALHFNLGYHLQASGRLDEALAAYRRAAELVPDYAPLYTNIASIHLARGEPEAALAAMRDALALQPDDGRTWGNVGMVLGGTGRFAEAEQAFRRATELMPDEAPMHFNLGLALMRQGKNEEAVAALRRALQIDPEMEAARQALRALGGG